MKLNEFIKQPLEEVLKTMDVADINFESDKEGNLKVIHLTYVEKVEKNGGRRRDAIF